MERWTDGLSNRNADDDRSRIARHLIPRFGSSTIERMTLADIMEWLDDLKKTKLSGQSRRHLLNLVSRFFSWAIERGMATVNPVKMIPEGKRPKPQRPRDVPWLEDDSLVPALLGELDPVVGLMFYLGNRSGLRTGEAAGLRMSDLDFLQEGVIRVRFSWDGPLKEDKDGSGKLKVGPGRARRHQGAQGPFSAAEAGRRRQRGFWFFPSNPPSLRTAAGRLSGPAIARSTSRPAGRRLPKSLASTSRGTRPRDTPSSRAISRTARASTKSSAALGHSSPVVTRMYYDHYVRKTFSAGLRQGLTDTKTLANANATKPVEPRTGQ